MLRLARAFWDIAFWHKSPAQLPASVFLLCLVAGAAALLEVIGAYLPATPSGAIVLRIALSVLLPLLFAWLVLAIARQRQRFLQTGTALLGVAVLAEIVLYPLGSLLNFVGVDQPAALPIGVLLVVGLVWYLLACANIWRAALDARLALGAAISLGYLLLSMVLEQQLLPQT
jgi:hypothetical protein